MDKIGVESVYTQQELEYAFKNAVKGLAKTPNLTTKYFIENIALLNTAASVLSDTSKIKGTEQVYSKIICNKLGITFEEAQIIHRRLKAFSKTKYDFEAWLDNRRTSREKYEDKKEEIIAKISRHPQLVLIRYDRLVSMYEGDLEFDGINKEFKTWVDNLVSLSNFIIDNKIDLFIDKEYREYINDLNSGTSFLKYLGDKAVEMDLCKDLGITYYDAKHKYDYNVSNMTFKAYLESQLALKDYLAKLDISMEILDKYYKVYLEKGYKGAKFEFAKELAESIDYCIDIDCGYFILKEKYENLPDECKPSSFSKWLKIEKVVYSLGGYAKIMEAIYDKEVEKGYSGEIMDLFKILTGFNHNEDTNGQKTL